MRFEELAGCLDADEARMKHPLVLAYIGDTVYDLIFRTRAVCSHSGSVNLLHREVCSMVNARAQSEAVTLLEPMFTEEETEIFRRGRNAKSATAPKNMSLQDYRRATGLEAVVGYIYLTGKTVRLDILFDRILGEQ